MKILLDQGLPCSVANLLRKTGINTLHVADIEMSSAKDIERLEHARNNGQIVVTRDADFHSLLALTGSIFPSIILLRKLLII